MVTYYHCLSCQSDLFTAKGVTPSQYPFCGGMAFNKIAKGDILEGESTKQGTIIKVDGIKSIAFIQYFL